MSGLVINKVLKSLYKTEDKAKSYKGASKDINVVYVDRSNVDLVLSEGKITRARYNYLGHKGLIVDWSKKFNAYRVLIEGAN